MGAVQAAVYDLRGTTPAPAARAPVICPRKFTLKAGVAVRALVAGIRCHVDEREEGGVGVPAVPVSFEVAAECHGDGREQSVPESFEEAAQRHLARFNLNASSRSPLAKLMMDHAEGKPWGYLDCARDSHLALLTWAHEHGAPWKAWS
jgi:hypothetical protein